MKKDLKYLWHPYTQMKDCELFPPILIERAEGVKVYDDRGNFYYDTISSWWSNVHGHNHPKIKQAIKEQLDKIEHILFAGFTHKPAILLAEKLIQITPKSLSRVFFSDNGSTAVETALKMSFQYWQNIGRKKKQRFVCLDYGYHGDTIGAMSVSGLSLFNRRFRPLLFPSFRLPSPYCYRCPMEKKRDRCAIECAEPVERLLRERGEEICALILEPLLLGAGGMIVYPKEYLKKVRRITYAYNVHLIVDEIATGFGRTGKMFACEYADIEPDLLCLSKGITAGYLPLGATLSTEEIYQAFYAEYKEKKTFYHGHTYTANPLSCSAGLASLQVFSEEKVLSRISKIIPFFQRELKKMKELACVGDVRGIGMIGAMELVQDKKRKKRFEFAQRIGFKIYQRGLERQIILRPLGDVIYLFLPLCISKKEIEEILDRCYVLLKEIKD